MTEIGWNVGVIVIMGICAVMDCLWKKVWMPLVWGMGVYILIWTLMSGEFSGERIMTQFLPGVLVAVILYTASVLTQGQIGRWDRNGDVGYGSRHGTGNLFHGVQPVLCICGGSFSGGVPA